MPVELRANGGEAVKVSPPRLTAAGAYGAVTDRLPVNVAD
jgi:hypothetical protein